MAYRYNIVVFRTTGVHFYEIPDSLVGLEAIVRGGGGGGASGRHDVWEEDCEPGPGGGGGGCSMTPRMLRRDELGDGPIELRVGAGGSGGMKSSGGWTSGSAGGNSWFGNFVYAGGGGGGGRQINDDGTSTSGLTLPGLGGYGMSRGGRGLTYRDKAGTGWFWNYTPFRFSEADSFNAAHMAAGGGGGGHGEGYYGTWEDVEDEEGNVVDEELVKTYYRSRAGGSSGAFPSGTVKGANGEGSLPHWETLQTGCGGNGGDTGNGGNGGFPGGGGAGGAGNNVLSRVGNGGRGGSGSVTIIELYYEE